MANYSTDSSINFVNSFPTKPSSNILPLVVVIGGHIEVGFAQPEAMSFAIPDSLKEKAIFVLMKQNESLLSAKTAGDQIAKSKKLKVSDVKVLAFSKGAETLSSNINSIQNISYIGLIDPSPAGAGPSPYSDFSNRVRMNYNPNAWSESKLKNLFKDYVAALKSFGSMVDVTDIPHNQAVNKFFVTYEAEIAEPINNPEVYRLRSLAPPQASSEVKASNTARDNALDVIVAPAADMQATYYTAPTPPSISMQEFENGAANPVTLDVIGGYLDLQTATYNGITAKMAEELHRRDTLKGIKFFRGQVYRKTVIETQNSSDSSNILFKLFNNRLIKYKVRIPEVHSYLPIPKKYGNDADEKDNKIIDNYPDFIFEPQGIFENEAGPGDIVTVTYGNLSCFIEGKVLNRVGPVSNGLGSYGPGGSNALSDGSMSQAFLQPSNLPEGTRVEIKPAYRNFNKIEMEMVYIGMNAAGNREEWLSKEAYSYFLLLQKAAKDAGHALKIGSAFRTQEHQLRLFDPRMAANGKPKGVVKDPDSPRGTEIEAWYEKPGPPSGRAALPGSSPHQVGVAVDIDGIGGFGTDAYRWMKNHASAYGFDNKVGANINEPWHWEFNGKTQPIAKLTVEGGDI